LFFSQWATIEIANSQLQLKKQQFLQIAKMNLNAQIVCEQIKTTSASKPVWLSVSVAVRRRTVL
jgi:hypothetical protein